MMTVVSERSGYEGKNEGFLMKRFTGHQKKPDETMLMLFSLNVEDVMVSLISKMKKNQDVLPRTREFFAMFTPFIRAVNVSVRCRLDGRRGYVLESIMAHLQESGWLCAHKLDCS